MEIEDGTMEMERGGGRGQRNKGQENRMGGWGSRRGRVKRVGDGDGRREKVLHLSVYC